MGVGELIPCSAFAFCVCSFCFRVDWSLTQPMSFLGFYPFDFLPSPTGGGVSEQLPGAWFLVGLNHDTIELAVSRPKVQLNLKLRDGISCTQILCSLLSVCFPSKVYINLKKIYKYV